MEKTEINKTPAELVAGAAEMLKQLTEPEKLGHQIELRQQIIHDLVLALEGLPALVSPLDHHAARSMVRLSGDGRWGYTHWENGKCRQAVTGIDEPWNALSSLLSDMSQDEKPCCEGDACSWCRHVLSLEFNRGERYGYDQGYEEAQQTCPLSGEQSPAFRAGYKAAGDKLLAHLKSLVEKEAAENELRERQLFSSMMFAEKPTIHSPKLEALKVLVDEFVF